MFRWAVDAGSAGWTTCEARLSINRNCWKVNPPLDRWGKFEQIQGTARVFVPDGLCYECTMSETDWKPLQNRRSCNLLSRTRDGNAARRPIKPTISSIIAGRQMPGGGHGAVLHGLEMNQGERLGLSTA